MNEYHKIKNVFKRDQKTHKLIINEFSLPEFQYLSDYSWEVTEKIDGTNIRVMWKDNKLSFSGRSDNSSMPVFLLDKLNDIFQNETMVNAFKKDFEGVDICIYGEGYGRKIQKIGARYIEDGVDFIVFDIKIGKWWLIRKDVEDICNKLGLRVVPFAGKYQIYVLQEAIDLIRYGVLKSNFGDFPAEGVVCRPQLGLLSRSGERIITKIKQADFQ